MSLFSWIFTSDFSFFLSNSLSFHNFPSQQSDHTFNQLQISNTSSRTNFYKALDVFLSILFLYNIVFEKSLMFESVFFVKFTEATILMTTFHIHFEQNILIKIFFLLTLYKLYSAYVSNVG